MNINWDELLDGSMASVTRHIRIYLKSKKGDIANLLLEMEREMPMQVRDDAKKRADRILEILGVKEMPS